jgi:hypothetical protein
MEVSFPSTSISQGGPPDEEPEEAALLEVEPPEPDAVDPCMLEPLLPMSPPAPVSPEPSPQAAM